MDEDTSGIYKVNPQLRVQATSENAIAISDSVISKETAIIDLSEGSNEDLVSNIHCLESISYLKKRKASQLLAIELERLRVLNGRMCRVIDRFLAQDPKELGPRASLIRNAFVEELSVHGHETHGVFLKIGRRENVEGSLYINFGADIIRYRWDGTGGSQHMYLNGDGNFFRARSNAYAILERFAGRQMHLVFNECPDTKPVSRRISTTLSNVEQMRYEQELQQYKALKNRIKSLFGKGLEKPVPPAETPVSVRLSPLDLGLDFVEHEKLVRASGVLASGIERAIIAFQEIWGVALAADDRPQPED